MGHNNMLFDDDDDTAVEPPVLKVNEEFARRFEYNKRREELHRLQAKHPEMAEKIDRQLKKLAQQPKPAARPNQHTNGVGRSAREEEDGDDDDEDEDEEEDVDDDVTNLLEPKFLSTLLSIKKKDPAIYDPNKKFFSDESDDGSEDEEEEQQGAPASKRHKPMYLKDVIAKQVLEHGPDVESSSEEEDDDSKEQPLAYNQEKEQARKAFLDALKTEDGEDGNASDDDFGGGVLKKRGRLDPGEDGEAKDEEVNHLLQEYFGREDEKLTEQDKFLRNFILNKGWMDEREDGRYVPRYDEIMGDEDGEGERGGAPGPADDDQFWEQADRYEATYNFRFEEPGGTQLSTHPRVISDTVRKEESSRKKQRAAKAERRAAEVSAVKEEVKRLKNLKKKEIEERLARIESVAGKAAPTEDLLSTMLEGDFDPEEWDKQMAAAFNDDYYAADEAGDEVFDEEVGLDDLEGYDEEGEREGFEQLRKKLKAGQVGVPEDDGDGDDDGDDDDADDEGEGGKTKEEKAKALADERASLQRLLEEYYKLDYEDVVAGMPTRFRYKQVERNTFGLSIDDILQRSDKELNQVVGLKKLATYYDPGKKVRPNYKALEMLRKDAPANKKYKSRPHQGGKQFFDREDQANGWHRRSDRHQDSKNNHQHAKTEEPKSAADGPEEPVQGVKTEAKGTATQQSDKTGQENRKRKRRGDPDAWKKPATAEKTREQLRMESYAKLSLHKGGPVEDGAGPKGKKKKKTKKQDGGEAGDAAVNSGPSRYELVPGWSEMTKAQRKNYIRAEKRASKKQKVE